MPKGIFTLDFFSVGLIICHAGPREKWAHSKGAPRMCEGINPLTGGGQSLYFAQEHPTMPGWFKGMEEIIRERGLWPVAGLLADCPGQGSGPRCPPDRNDCCCRKLLYNQPDFVSQKSELQEFVEKRGHLCDFYPKYHCELNFIEQYWGAAKLHFRTAGRGATIEDMKKKVLTSLDGIPIEKIHWCAKTFLTLTMLSYCIYYDRYANHSARFIHAYGEGLTGAQAAWANRKYHSHHTLPPDMIRDIKDSILP
jgi:hypothetical protein